MTNMKTTDETQPRRSSVRRTNATAGEPAKPSAAESDAPMPDLAERRRRLALELNHMIAEITEAWRRCPLRACKRTRGCRDVTGACRAPRQQQTVTEEEAARNMAEFYKAVKRRLQELPAEEHEADAGAAPAPRARRRKGKGR